MTILKSYMGKTDQGPYLQINEDDFAVDLANKLFMIFDGFGGSGRGDLAVEVLKESILRLYTKIGGDPESTLPFSYDSQYSIEANALINCFQYSQIELNKKFDGKDINQRGGASCICAAISDDNLKVVSTGNCLVYLYRQGKLIPLFTPHNFQLYSKDTYLNHFYTQPMSGFGLYDKLVYELREAKIFENDRYLFLTDGSYARLIVEDIKYILDKNTSDSEKLKSLFEMSNQRGNLDNQSALLLNF